MLGKYEKDALQDVSGDAMTITGATVTVKAESTGLNATLYQDEAGTTSLTNPFTVAGTTIAFYASAGDRYRIDIVKDPLSRTLRFESVTMAAQEGISNLSSAGALTGTEQFAVVQTTTKKSTISAIITYLLGLANTFTGDNDIKDTLEIYDPTDNTKKVRIDAGSVSTATTRVLTMPDRDITVPDPLTSGTAIATTSGTAHDFTGIPAWVKKITITMSELSTNGTSVPIIQIGDSGGIEATGYTGTCSAASGTATGSAQFTTGFGINNAQTAAYVLNSSMVLSLHDATINRWSAAWVGGQTDGARSSWGGGSKSLSGVLTTVRLTTVNGTDTFDSGAVNILYE